MNDENATVQSQLVELTKVTSRSRADVIVSMLNAYGIHANAPRYNLPRTPFIPIHVPSSELDAARALITDIMAEVDPAFAPPNQPAASAQTVVTPSDGNALRGILAAIVAIAIILLCGHVGGRLWLINAANTTILEDRMVQAAIMLSSAAFFGVVIARLVCDLLLKRYSDMTVFIALVLFGSLGVIPLLFTNAPASAIALQSVPSLVLVITAWFIFWPGEARPGR